MKLKDSIKPYDGQGCVVEWLEKLEAAAEVTGETDLTKVFPLLLEGHAYSVYSHLKTEVKKSAEEVKKALTKSFGLDEFDAFEQLCQLQWNGQSVDVFAARIRNLAKQADLDTDEFVRKKLVTSLPLDVSRQLRALTNSTKADLPATIVLARTLMAQHADSDKSSFSAAARITRRLPPSDRTLSDGA